MKRDDVVVELQRRINLIRIVNGYDFDVTSILRNPEEETDPRLMPCVNMFELLEGTVKGQHRSGSVAPVYLKQLRLALELWYISTTEGECSRDIQTFLKYIRQVEFSDGSNFGGLASEVIEEEVSSVLRPGVGNNVVGIGQILTVTYFEDFSNL